MLALNAKYFRPSVTAGPPTKPESQISLGTSISNTSSLAELHSILLKAKSSADLGVEDDLSVGRPLHEAGVDSLTAVQLRTWFRREIDVDVSVLSIMSNQSLRGLVGNVAEKVRKA